MADDIPPQTDWTAPLRAQADAERAALLRRIDALAADEARLLADDPDRYWNERRSIEAAIAASAARDDATLAAVVAFVTDALRAELGETTDPAARSRIDRALRWLAGLSAEPPDGGGRQ